MRSETVGGSFQKKNKVPVGKQTSQVGDFFSFLGLEAEHAAISRTRTVASATVFLAEMREILEKVRPKPTSGHISEWIDEAETWCSNLSIRPLILLFKAIDDPRNARIVEESFSDIKNEIQSYIPALRNDDFSPLNIWLQNIADKLGITGNVQIIPSAAVFRAIQVELKCLVFYRTSAARLIEKAKGGDKDAVLKLIRADYLFFDDPCTKSVINRAALDNDEAFFSSPKNALKITEKDLVRIGIYLFSAIESKKTKVEIRNLLDPDWTKFKEREEKEEGEASSGFEQFVKRARRDLKRILDRPMPSNGDMHAGSEAQPH